MRLLHHTKAGNESIRSCSWLMKRPFFSIHGEKRGAGGQHKLDHSGGSKPPPYSSIGKLHDSVSSPDQYGGSRGRKGAPPVADEATWKPNEARRIASGSVARRLCRIVEAPLFGGAESEQGSTFQERNPPHKHAAGFIFLSHVICRRIH